MKLVVGLGNPGKQYERTRHNCGFMAIDYYAEKNNLSFKNKFNGLYAEHNINQNKLILLKPQTFMNLSGICVRKFIDFYNINIDDVIVIYDDKDFDVGTFKIKRNGSSAGHNGIKNIIENLKTEEIKRIKIGISKNEIPLEEYVLKKMSNEDSKKIDGILPIIASIIDDFAILSIDELMEKYNRK